MIVKIHPSVIMLLSILLITIGSRKHSIFYFLFSCDSAVLRRHRAIRYRSSVYSPRNRVLRADQFAGGCDCNFTGSSRPPPERESSNAGCHACAGKRRDCYDHSKPHCKVDHNDLFLLFYLIITFPIAVVQFERREAVSPKIDSEGELHDG